MWTTGLCLQWNRFLVEKLGEHHNLVVRSFWNQILVWKILVFHVSRGKGSVQKLILSFLRNFSRMCVRINFSPTYLMSGWCEGVIFMSLFCYMFQSILNTFVFGYFCWWGKINYFHETTQPFAENFRENNPSNFLTLP